MNSYNQVDQQLHILSQIIAKANRTYLPAKEDDSHTNLAFNPEKGRLEGRWIDTPTGKVLLSLRVTDMCFVWLNESGEAFQTVSTGKKEVDEVEQSLIRGIEKSGLDPEGFTEPMHYEIPEYSATGKPVQLLTGHAIGEWKFWRELANKAAEIVLSQTSTEAEIRIWPHHFDTGIYAEPDDKIGIGFGLAMKDEMAGAPYFYLSGYGLDGEIDYSGIPELKHGKWEIHDGFKGAVLTLPEIPKDQVLETLEKFSEQCLDWYLNDQAG